MYLDPVVSVVTLLFLVQALVFFWLGSCWGHRGQRALELRLKATGDKLKLVEATYQQYTVRAEVKAARQFERLKMLEASYQEYIDRAEGCSGDT